MRQILLTTTLFLLANAQMDDNALSEDNRANDVPIDIRLLLSEDVFKELSSDVQNSLEGLFLSDIRNIAAWSRKLGQFSDGKEALHALKKTSETSYNYMKRLYDVYTFSYQGLTPGAKKYFDQGTSDIKKLRSTDVETRKRWFLEKHAAFQQLSFDDQSSIEDFFPLVFKVATDKPFRTNVIKKLDRLMRDRFSRQFLIA
ncbi:unnamed protein product, partial [Mesorhabditis spiculigera]